MQDLLEKIKAIRARIDQLAADWTEVGNWIFLAALSVASLREVEALIGLIAVFIFFLIKYKSSYELLMEIKIDIDKYKQTLKINYSNNDLVYCGFHCLIKKEESRIGFFSQLKSAPILILALLFFLAVLHKTYTEISTGQPMKFVAVYEQPETKKACEQTPQK